MCGIFGFWKEELFEKNLFKKLLIQFYIVVPMTLALGMTKSKVLL